MTVEKNTDGTFRVTSAGAIIKDGFPTNAAAWRWLDRQSGDLVSKSEDRSAYWQGQGNGL